MLTYARIAGQDNLTRLLVLAAALFAIAVGVLIAVLADTQVVSGSVSSEGLDHRVETRESFVESQGLRGLALLGVPAMACLIALAAQYTGFARPARRTVAALLTAFALLGSLSIGFFFWLPAVAMIAAAVRRHP